MGRLKIDFADPARAVSEGKTKLALFLFLDQDLVLKEQQLVIVAVYITYRVQHHIQNTSLKLNFSDMRTGHQSFSWCVDVADQRCFCFPCFLETLCLLVWGFLSVLSAVYYYHMLQINTACRVFYFFPFFPYPKQTVHFLNQFFPGITRGLVTASAWLAWLCHRDQFYTQSFSITIFCWKFSWLKNRNWHTNLSF